MAKQIIIDISQEGRLTVSSDSTNALEILGMLELGKTFFISQMKETKANEQKTT